MTLLLANFAERRLFLKCNAAQTSRAASDSLLLPEDDPGDLLL